MSNIARISDNFKAMILSKIYNEQSVPKDAPLKIVDVQSFIGLQRSCRPPANAMFGRRQTICGKN